MAKSGVWDNVPEGSTLIFEDTHIFLQRSVGYVEGSLHTKTQLDSRSRFNAIPVCDRRTRDSISRSSVTSRGKN